MYSPRSFPVSSGTRKLEAHNWECGAGLPNLLDAVCFIEYPCVAGKISSDFHRSFTPNSFDVSISSSLLVETPFGSRCAWQFWNVNGVHQTRVASVWRGLVMLYEDQHTFHMDGWTLTEGRRQRKGKERQAITCVSGSKQVPKQDLLLK